MIDSLGYKDKFLRKAKDDKIKSLFDNIGYFESDISVSNFFILD